MSTPRLSTSPAVAAFRALHESGCFVLPNPWDVGTAVYLQHLGFKAIATTSGGFAFSQGRADNQVPLDVVLAHLRDVAAAVSVPVNADFEGGYARDPEGVASNVALCVATGVAGLSIEDASGDRDAPLYESTLAVERIRAARAAVDATGTGVVLTGRCEAWLVGQPEPRRTVLDRLVAYADAGADCLFAPGVRDPADIEVIVKAVRPKPVNVLISTPTPGLSVARLAELGVRRVSVGSALARAAWGGFIRAARGLLEAGTFDGLAEAASYPELNHLFREHRRG
ncbi:MAG: isocitrate lyase/phosphoenolpyruvate mutase family protein [Polyangiaceae bacterium]|jgi:2-methylisocitrate lyase-like PEP mutase family enzyme